MAGYYFRLPAITQLTIPQQAALNEPKQIALSGGPGTGKSVVSLWRHISNYKNGKRSLLLTYTTTLKQYLKACCRLQDLNAASNVGTLYRNKPKKPWDEIIIDEAQDMANNYYQSIRLYGSISYGADDSQILYPEHCSKQIELSAIFPNNIKYVLNKNFRSTQRIMQFCKQAFPYANIPLSILQGLSNNVGEKPVMLVSNGNRFDCSNNNQDEAIVRIINSFRANDHNIAILVPWKRDARTIENVLKSKNIGHSIYYEDEKRFPSGAKDIDNIHITTFKSSKGLEFDTVIIPNFDIIRRTPIYIRKEETMTEDSLKSMKTNIEVLEQSQKKHDVIISETLRQDGLIDVIFNRLMCSWEDVYVACTRARSNLYLISNNDLPQLHNVVDFENIDNQNKTNNQSFTNNYGNSRGTSNTITILNDDRPF